jgi:hypothetical protein
MAEETIGLGEGMAPSRNGLGVELESKNFKVPSSKLRVVVCAIKVAHF